eukprot:gene26433-17533_t
MLHASSQCKAFSGSNVAKRTTSARVTRCLATNGKQDPLLLRTARGEDVERTPVWLMRQAGRYMAAFREYSDKYPFRMRSETPEIAIELSLQPLRAFKPDAVIFFSDILTPLPALGIEFDVIKGKGPAIMTPIRSIEQVRSLRPMEDPTTSLPFIQTILSSLRKEVDNSDATLMGFIGTPWTLAAYSMEGNPDEFAVFSLPYMDRIAKSLKAKYPHVPVIMHCNGGTGKLEQLTSTNADVIGLDWAVDIAHARKTLGQDLVVQGNVSPMVLFGPEKSIIEATNRCLLQAGPKGHILNVGHGVVQGTPEENVALFCELARNSGSLFKSAHKADLAGAGR